MKNWIILHREVEEALRHHRPIVALESTIITHGLPYPENLTMARKVERIVRDHGAVPATIAFLKGMIHVGLTEHQLEALAQEKNVEKVSRRDVSMVLSQKRSGGTTVATTMWIAHEVGIRVFATGGIGGVHRGAEQTMDISSDLEEFTRSPIAVVSAGAKAILDLPKTLEYLETKGVPVIGYQTQVFPAFYYSDSGIVLKSSVQSVEELARTVAIQSHIDTRTGVLIANPIPKEHALPKEAVEKLIQQAIHEANEQNISGYQLTPFLLARLKTLSHGESVESNLALVFNNAKVASQLAVALSKMTI
jgi:pseudouridine-5'-phosphate glycosidase